MIMPLLLPYDMALECRVENSLALVAKIPSHFHKFLFVDKQLVLKFRLVEDIGWPHMGLCYVEDNIYLLLANIIDFLDNDTLPEYKNIVIQKRSELDLFFSAIRLKFCQNNLLIC